MARPAARQEQPESVNSTVRAVRMQSRLSVGCLRMDEFRSPRLLPPSRVAEGQICGSPQPVATV